MCKFDETSDLLREKGWSINCKGGIPNFSPRKYESSDSDGLRLESSILRRSAVRLRRSWNFWLEETEPTEEWRSRD